MTSSLIKTRNWVLHAFYTKALKPFFFLFDPELVHDGMCLFGRALGSNPLTRGLTRAAFGFSHPMLEQDILGISFKNPLGLSAGFDKNARLTAVLAALGFGFEEVGSITGEACEGNPRPRLWRIPELRSIRVNYGLKNDGATAISKRLSRKHFRFPVGTSIAKTNCACTVETPEAIADYTKAFEAFTTIGAYFTINISCPNAYGGQPFTDPEKLEKLLARLDTVDTKKPVFLKLSPDLSTAQLDAILEVASRHKVDGYVCSNLTKKHERGVGGLSGKAVEDLSNAQLRYVYQKTKGKAVLMGCGGVSSAEDAYAKIKAGASLIQLITGLIYEGPQLVSEINRGLVELLKKDGYSNISEAVGKD